MSANEIAKRRQETFHGMLVHFGEPRRVGLADAYLLPVQSEVRVYEYEFYTHGIGIGNPTSAVYVPSYQAYSETDGVF